MPNFERRNVTPVWSDVGHFYAEGVWEIRLVDMLKSFDVGAGMVPPDARIFRSDNRWSLETDCGPVGTPIFIKSQGMSNKHGESDDCNYRVLKGLKGRPKCKTLKE